MASNSEHLKIVEKAIHFMKTNLHDDVTSENLADHVGYSTSHFVRVFKEVTGVSPRLYLSALRIEDSKKILLQTPSSILKTVLSIGFRSLGTYSSRFKQFVGLTPKEFQGSTILLTQFLNEYKNVIMLQKAPVNQTGFVCHLEIPEDYKGLIFVGLFPRPIPDQKPVCGMAVSHHQTTCIFSDIPAGTFYALAAALPFSLNPKNYFLLERTLRGKADHPIEIPSDSAGECTIILRPPLPQDPPILINLPKLLFEKENKIAK